MRVLLIDVNCKCSSTGQIVYNLYSYLNSHGDEAAVCYGRGKKIAERNIYKFGLDWETYLHALLTRVTGFTGCFSYFSTKRLLRFIKNFNPDVVHIHELHAYFVNIKPLLRYLARNNIKVVHTLHCEFSYTGKCGHSVECEKWKVGCGKCPHIHNYVRAELFDHTKYMFRQKKELFSEINNLIITAPSKWLYDRVGESFFKNRSRYVVHNGVDTDIFRPVDVSQLREKFKIREGERVVLALAPNLMTKEKGGPEVKRLAKKLRNENIRFVFVGVDGAKEQIEDNTIICGRIYDKELLSQFYSLADAFVICSERENYPTTCLEAQACGTPIYGYSAGGIMETYLQREKHFVEYGNINALATILSKIPYKSNEIQQVIRELAIKKISNEISMMEYSELYRNEIL